MPVFGALIVAHRGASHQAPENTLAAFELAWHEGADAIEGDFYLSKDNAIVCIHDSTTKRTSGVNLKVSETNLEELRQLDVGSWKSPDFVGERIPVLSEVLATVPPGKQILIEIKCGPEIVPYLKRELIRTQFPSDQTVVISFQAAVIAAVKNQIPNVKAFWLTGYKRDSKDDSWKPSPEEILHTLKTTRADGLDSQAHRIVDASLVQRLRAADYEFHVWTVDDPADARRMRSLGADSITTNRPRYLRDALDGGQ